MPALKNEMTAESTLPLNLPAEEIFRQPPPAIELGQPGRGLRAALWLQARIGQLVVIPFGGALVLAMRYWRGYQFERLAEIRAQFRAITQDRTPLMICGNHLTFIDSALIIWALATTPRYFAHYRLFSWNLPAGDFFKKKFRYRIVAFLSKCIFLHRDGSKTHKNLILGICRHMLLKGEVVTIFPEGRRSRSGRFDVEGVTYGVGKLISSMDRCRVLCIYVRGDKQHTYTNYPPKGSNIRLMMKVIEPKTTRTGRDGYFDITSQIAHTIKTMETEYFAAV